MAGLLSYVIPSLGEAWELPGQKRQRRL